MGNEESYGFVEPFFIDDGELNGLSPQQAFVLGVEWEMIRSLIDRGEPFEKPFHSENHDRILQMLGRRNAGYTIYNHDDWPVLAYEGGGDR